MSLLGNGDCQLTYCFMPADHTEFTPDSHRLHHHNHSDVFSIDELKQLCQSYTTESVLLLSPDVFDRLRSVEKQSIVVVVSPLVALTKDQVAEYCSMGLNAAYVNGKHGNEDMQQGVFRREVSTRVYEPRNIVYYVEMERNAEGKAILY